MEYNIQSKPTIYNGTKYRSRLEARWAAFFDKIGWRYQYEPYDLNGWTPDFIVYGSEDRFILFEVKPFINDQVIAEYKPKILKSFTTKFHPPCIILDNQFKDDPSYGGLFAGFRIAEDQSFQVHWKDAQKGINSEYDIGSLFEAFDGLLWQCDNRKSFLSENYNHHYNKFLNKWVEAGELTRFHYA